MNIRKFNIPACSIFILICVMISNISTHDPIEDSVHTKYTDNNLISIQQSTIISENNNFNKSKSIITRQLLGPSEEAIWKIKWPGMVMTLCDNTYRQRYYLNINPKIPLHKIPISRDKIVPDEEIIAKYIKRHSNIYNVSEAEGTSPVRLSEDIIGKGNIMFPLSIDGDISSAARELFKASGVSLDDISGRESEPHLQETLATDSRLSVVFAVLSSPSLIYSRLLPLLTTSLRDQSSVHVFFRKTNISHLAVKEVNSQLKIFHDRFMRSSVSAPFDPERVKVVELGGPRDYYVNMRRFTYNGWMNMQIIKYLGDHYSAIPFQSRAGEKSAGLEEESMQNGGRKDNPFSRWFCLVDDDGYVIVPNAEILLENATRYIGKVIANKTSTAYKERLGISRPLIVGSAFILPEEDNEIIETRSIQNTLNVIEVVQGGCGMFLNQAALEAIYPSNVWTLCSGKYLNSGGDVRLSACLLGEGGAAAVSAPSNMFARSPIRVLKNAKVNKRNVMPVSFHHIRNYKLFFIMRKVEHLRYIANNKSRNKRNNTIVSWGDLASNRDLYRK